MPQKYYLDTCIWRDYAENRSDSKRQLGELALSCIKKLVRKRSIIVFSDIVEKELLRAYEKEKLIQILSYVPAKQFLRIQHTSSQYSESEKLAEKKKVPHGDAFHAVIARDNEAVLITRDRHFSKLRDTVTVKKPEELL